MRTHSLQALAALVAAAGFGITTLAVSAQTPPPSGPAMGPAMTTEGPATTMPSNDREFVRALDAANTAELDMAKYVVNVAQDPAVRAFAQQMIGDHSSAAVNLEAATRGTGLFPAPRSAAVNRTGALALTMLQGESGVQRDNDYMRLQVPAHRRVLALLLWEMQHGAASSVKTLATNLAPTVQQHLQLAQTYLAAHNLTPYEPPMPQPVPGNVNPNGVGTPANPNAPNNPASVPANGSTPGPAATHAP